MNGKNENKLIVPDETVIGKIYLIRGEKVMLDRDLAKLYDVETKQLKRAVRRNIKRFPEDFMFELSKEEFKNWRSQIGTSNPRDLMGLRYTPYAFTELGVAQLSTVLNSERAIMVNIQIMRIFTKMRRTLLAHKDLVLKVLKIEKRVIGQDDKIQLLFDYLKKFIDQQLKPTKPIGFKTKVKNLP
ncbi:MAG: ORF6N domain-containing protein [Bacteroidetes bacterium]|nr:ORF6N domain-containing protein [Bacteroidota bacterium]